MSAVVSQSLWILVAGAFALEYVNLVRPGLLASKIPRLGRL